MTVIVKNAGKFEGVHYVANSTLSLPSDLELRMVNDGFATWQTPPDTIDTNVLVRRGADKKVKAIVNDDGTNADTAIPFRIVGDPNVGNILAVELNDGWSATGFQWTRNGVDIAGSTGITYKFQDIDVGKDIEVKPSGLEFAGAANGTGTPLTTARPAFMQANAVGYIGSFRSVSGHNSVCMYRAAADMDSVEATFSNSVWFESGSASEAFPSDGADLQVNANLFTPTWPIVETTRNFTAPFAEGATSGTLTADAVGSTLEYCRFSNGDYRWIKLTGTGTSAERRAVTWDKPLSSAAASNPRTLQTSNRGAFTFDGSPNMILKGGQFSIIQAIIANLNIKKFDPAYVNSYVSKVGGGAFLLPCNQPANWQDNLSNGLLEAYNDSTTPSNNTRFGSPPWYAIAGGANMFRPNALRGFNLVGNTYRPVTVFGDSIGSDPNSWLQTFLHFYGVPYVNLCKAGETAGEFINSANPVRKQILDRGCALVQMGRNSWNLTAIQQLWDYLTAQGFTRIIQVYPPPMTTTTDNGATEANQTQDTATSALFPTIDALVGTPNGPHAKWNSYDAVKGTDPLKWAAGYSSETGTLVHPNPTGRAAIVAYAIANNWINDLAL